MRTYDAPAEDSSRSSEKLLQRESVDQTNLNDLSFSDLVPRAGLFGTVGDKENSMTSVKLLDDSRASENTSTPATLIKSRQSFNMVLQPKRPS